MSNPKTFIAEYAHGLGGFLDEKGIKFARLPEGSTEQVLIEFNGTDAELFKLGFEFGKFYCDESNY